MHGFPKVMGVLTHLDNFTDAARLRKTKKALKQRFWAEIFNGAKLFYMSGLARCAAAQAPAHDGAVPARCAAHTRSHSSAVASPGAQVHGRYNKRDTLNLARFISVATARCRPAHSPAHARRAAAAHATGACARTRSSGR